MRTLGMLVAAAVPAPLPRRTTRSRREFMKRPGRPAGEGRAGASGVLVAAQVR